MAILNICEFTDRVETKLKLCERCRGILKEIKIHRLDALKYAFGKSNLTKRYKCVDCGCRSKRED